MTRCLSTIAVFLLAVSSVASPPRKPEIQAEISKSVVTVGEKALYTLRITSDPEILLEEPDPSGVFKDCHFKALPAERPVKRPDGRMEESKKYEIQFFEPGEKVLEPFRIGYSLENGEKGEIVSDEFRIDVTSVLEEGDEELRDIRGQVGYTGSPFYLILILLIIAAAVVLGYFLYRRYMMRKGAALEERKPEIPPHVTALQELKRLRSNAFPPKEEAKFFYVLLSEILKRYLGKRYGFDSLERTTFEIRGELKRASVPLSPAELAVDILERADMVKFAKYVPRKEEDEKAMDDAFSLVKQTTPVFTKADVTDAA